MNTASIKAGATKFGTETSVNSG